MNELTNLTFTYDMEDPNVSGRVVLKGTRQYAEVRTINRRGKYFLKNLEHIIVR